MKQVTKKNNKKSERGSAEGKLLISAIIFILLAYSGYNYIPVAFQGQSFKEDLESAMVKAISMPANKGTPKKLVTEKIQNAINVNGVPSDTFVDIQAKGNNISARVYYKKEVSILPFGLYNYEYVFDQTITPNGFITQ